MRTALFITGLSFLIIGSRLSAQTKIPDACGLISTESLNSIFDIKLRDGISTMKGSYCLRNTEDTKIEVVVQYVKFSTQKTAQSMLEMNLANNQSTIASHKKAVGIYDDIKVFPSAGESAHVMTGESQIYSPPDNSRLQFVLDSYLVTFDTRGILRATVSEKLPQIYAIIKKGWGL